MIIERIEPWGVLGFLEVRRILIAVLSLHGSKARGREIWQMRPERAGLILARHYGVDSDAVNFVR